MAENLMEEKKFIRHLEWCDSREEQTALVQNSVHLWTQMRFVSSPEFCC